MLRQQEQDRRQYRLICPCVPFYGADGDKLQGKAVWSEFAPILDEEKRRYLEQTFAKGDFARYEKYLQVKSRRQTAGRVPQIPAVRRFFASAGEKRLALICVL